MDFIHLSVLRLSATLYKHSPDIHIETKDPQRGTTSIAYTLEHT